MEYIRICPITGCGNEISYNRKDVYKNAINKNTICTKCCRAKRGSIYSKSLDEKIINLVKSKYYDVNKTLNMIADECNISFETLKKIIKNKNLPKIKRIGKIINRVDSYQKMFKTKFGIDYDEFLKNKNDFDRYKGRVKYYTNKTVKKFSKNIKNLNKVGRGEFDYHIDHIASIKECYLANIEPEIVADIINLRAIPSKENLSKGFNSIFSPEILLLNVNERKNNKININELTWNFL
jgi:DNA-binding Lrp family transcriptional regulator